MSDKSKHRILKGVLLSLLSLVVICIIAVVGLVLWLTPQRVTRLVNENAGKYLNADLTVGKIDYTLWSTFPTLHFRVDSLNIVSRSLDALPSGVMAQLPPDAKFLASSSELSGSLNILQALHGNISLDSIYAGQVRANIVIADDSTANFNIVPPGTHTPEGMRVAIGRLRLDSPVRLSVCDLPSHTRLSSTVNWLDLYRLRDNRDSYHVGMKASVEGSAAGVELPQRLDLTINGGVAVDFNPLSISTGDLALGIPGVEALVNMDLTDAGAQVLNSLSAEISTPDAGNLVKYVPEAYLSGLTKATALLSKYKVRLPLNLSLTLDAPYQLHSKEIPAFSAKVNIPGANFSIPWPMGGNVKVNNAELDASILYDPADPASDRLDISRLSLGADGLAVNLSGEVRHILADDPVIDADLSLNANLGKMEQSLLPSNSTAISGELNSSTHLNCALSGLTDASLRKLALKGELKSALLTVKEASSGVKVLLSGVSLKYSARLRDNPFSSASTWEAHPTSADDSILSARLQHSPLYLTPALPAMMQAALTMADADIHLKIADGEFSTDAYPTDNSFRNLDLSTNLDSLSIHNMEIAVANTKGDVSAEVGNLRTFLTSSSPALLTAKADMRFDRVDINRLTAAYYEGLTKLTGKRADYEVPSPGAPTAADSLCVAIPRNLSADVHLHSDRADYMQWSFSPLSTTLSTHDGNARIGDLNIGSEFAGVTVDWSYFTHDLSDIHMDIDVDVDDFNLPAFCRAFPMLAKDTPQLDEVAGNLNLDLDGSFLMYPDMYLNTPSMQARFTLRGEDLSIARTEPELRKITKFMLIKGDSIPVRGLDVHGSFHDNLLQVNPFTLDCGPYHLLLGGVNNLQGEMYYHAGLLDSPFHIPFGVNIVGNWRHPKIRFGGKGIKDGREREIAADLEDDVDVNIMTWLRQGWLEFVAAAAKYYAGSAQSFSASNVE
jgi:hypothetical protein